jgi:hypothetical protein
MSVKTITNMQTAKKNSVSLLIKQLFAFFKNLF